MLIQKIFSSRSLDCIRRYNQFHIPVVVNMMKTLHWENFIKRGKLKLAVSYYSQLNKKCIIDILHFIVNRKKCSESHTKTIVVSNSLN